MRRRTWLVGTVMATAYLVVGVGFASAGSAATTGKPVTLKCKISMATPPPADTNVVTQPPLAGTFFGPSHCRTKGFGGGSEAAPFKLLDTGDTVGRYVQYFAAGSIKGKFDLTPGEGQPPSAATFESATWTGTVTVTGGTGVYSGIKELKGKKNIGTITCSSPDNVHLSCKEKIKLSAI